MDIRFLRVLGSSEDSQVGTGHTEQTTVGDGSDGRVDKWRGGTIWVKIHHIHARGRCSARVHQCAKSVSLQLVS